MAGKTLLYIGAALLFLIGLCLLGYGVLSIIGSTAPTGSPSWLTFGIGFSIGGVIFLAAGAGLIYAATRAQKTEVIQQVKIDLPGETKIEAVQCRACGGTLSAKDITLVNGAPMVNCPYCHTVYQLTEEPKW